MNNPHLRYYQNGNLWIEQHKNYCNKFHKESSPAIIEYWPNGNIKKKEYYTNGVNHRENGPAYIEYYESGGIFRIMFIDNNKFHKEDGPAIIEHYEDGNTYLEKYMQNSRIHRFHGPAVIHYYKNGKIKETFYLKGISYTKKVEKWIINNKFNSWKDMSYNDFDRMWLDIFKN